MIFKKVDTRLKGHPGTENLALARAFDRTRLVIAPAVPNQHRLTSGGQVVGGGVAEPIAIADAFPAGQADLVIASDVRTTEDLARHRLVSRYRGRRPWTG